MSGNAARIVAQNITGPTNEQIRHAMRCKFKAEYDGIVYRRIVGICLRVLYMNKEETTVLQVELLSQGGGSITVVDPKKVTILNYWE